jgi:hypothetical protein
MDKKTYLVGGNVERNAFASIPLADGISQILKRDTFGHAIPEWDYVRMSEAIPNLLDHLDIFHGHRDRIAIRVFYPSSEEVT